MSGNQLTFDGATRAATGRWQDILELLGIDPAHLRPQHGPCPGCGGRDRFRFDDKDGRGTFICGGGGGQPIAGDGFDLLCHTFGWGRYESLQRVALLLSMSQLPRRTFPTARTKSDIDEMADTKRNQARMVRLWSGARPISEDDFVARYLALRGLSLNAFPDALRYHPSLAYWHEIGGKPQSLGEFPAMLATITDHAGRWVGLHRTYLTQHGGKADVRHPVTGESLPAKKMLSIAPGACMGAAVRLADPSPDGLLVVAEGIETALAAGILSGRPAWACLSANGLKSLRLRPPVRDVLIAADNDENNAGQSAARILAAILIGGGFVARMEWPNKPGSDWLDVLNSDGGAA